MEYIFIIIREVEGVSVGVKSGTRLLSGVDERLATAG